MCLFVFKLIDKKEVKRIFAELSAATDEIGAEILEFEFDSKFFGNIILKIKKDDKIYEFIADRDEIYAKHDRKSFLCQYPEKPYKKIIELIHELK